MKTIIILFLLVFIIFVSFYKSRRIEPFKVISNLSDIIKCKKYNKTTNSQLKKYLDTLSNKVSKLEYMLHRSNTHNQFKNKINNLEKKYNKAYKWYRSKNIKDKKMAKDISKEMVKELT
jgi:GTPase Era involved in 16S rRNA processing